MNNILAELLPGAFHTTLFTHHMVAKITKTKYKGAS